MNLFQLCNNNLVLVQVLVLVDRQCQKLNGVSENGSQLPSQGRKPYMDGNHGMDGLKSFTGAMVVGIVSASLCR